MISLLAMADFFTVLQIKEMLGGRNLSRFERLQSDEWLGIGLDDQPAQTPPRSGKTHVQEVPSYISKEAMR